MDPKQMTDDDWRQKLTPEQYKVLRQQGTEAPWSGEFLKNDAEGTYSCAGCGAVLFTTKDQYESHLPGLAGWPSFADVAEDGAVEFVPDSSLGMERTEARCKNCGGHLGHFFDDPTSPNGKHYCINSVALDFEKK